MKLSKQLDDFYTKEPGITNKILPYSEKEGTNSYKHITTILLIGLLFVLMMRKVGGPVAVVA